MTGRVRQHRSSARPLIPIRASIMSYDISSAHFLASPGTVLSGGNPRRLKHPIRRAVITHPRINQWLLHYSCYFWVVPALVQRRLSANATFLFLLLLIITLRKWTKFGGKSLWCVSSGLSVVFGMVKPRPVREWAMWVILVPAFLLEG